MSIFQSMRVADEVVRERVRQDMKWGEQNHPNGTSRLLTWMADMAREQADDSSANGDLTWMEILNEEFYEAISEEDARKLREELIQVAAVAVAWVEAIDRADSR